MANAPRDANQVPTMLAVDDVTGEVVPIPTDADGNVLIAATISGGSGTVTDVSVVSANGFAGSVATSTTTPAITLSTTISGILSGNGTAISAASTTGSGSVVLATSPTLVTPNIGAATASSLNINAGGTSALVVDTNTFVVDATNNKVGFGTTTMSNITSSTRVEFDDADGTNSDWSFRVAGAGYGVINFASSRGTLAAPTAVLSGQQLGELTFRGYDGANYIPSASIKSFVDTTPGTNDMPGSIVIYTVPDGSATLTEAVRISNNQTTSFAAKIFPYSNDGAPLGDTTHNFSDLFLATGAVINYANGNVTITHSSGLLTFSSPVTLGTSNAFTCGTIELGAASDTTISRSSAGVIAVEGVVIPSISSTNTLTNKRVTRRLTTTNAPGATPTTNSDNVDVMNFTGLNTAITSMTTNLSGTPSDGDLLEFRFLDDGTARAITWGTSFAATTVALPTTTVISTCLRALFEWRSASSKWECVATA